MDLVERFLWIENCGSARMKIDSRWLKNKADTLITKSGSSSGIVMQNYEEASTEENLCSFAWNFSN